MDGSQSPIDWRFENTYASLPEVFWSAARPARFRAPRASIINERLAGEMGLDLTRLGPESAVAMFSGQSLPNGTHPLAQAYAGHQFGHFTMLGDGRAILLGEYRTPVGRLVDIQLKGAGQTRYSRNGDGRAALGPMLREYVISEAMHALGIPTTRSLAVVTTGEPVFRESPRRGAVLTRVASSHLRVGTFEYAAALDDESALRALADYAITRHDPELTLVPDKYLAWFRAVLDRQAALVARWQLVGFIHGVMNTDNMAISGETIDYGPCAFMNGYDPATVFSSIDRGSRYAYANQPVIAHWNLVHFAESILPLFNPDPEQAIAAGTEVLSEFPKRFEHYWLDGLRQKLGIRTSAVGDLSLVQGLLAWMKLARADFTNTFRDLSTDGLLANDRYQHPVFQEWHALWQDRLAQDGDSPSQVVALMKTVNPVAIPRNHRVEEALTAAEEQNDFAPLQTLLDVVCEPFTERPGLAAYLEPPTDECGYRTFCGT